MCTVSVGNFPTDVLRNMLTIKRLVKYREVRKMGGNRRTDEISPALGASLLIALRGEDDSCGSYSNRIKTSQIVLIYNNLQKDDRLRLSQAVVNCIKRFC